MNAVLAAAFGEQCGVPKTPRIARTEPDRELIPRHVQVGASVEISAVEQHHFRPRSLARSVGADIEFKLIELRNASQWGKGAVAADVKALGLIKDGHGPERPVEWALTATAGDSEGYYRLTEVTPAGADLSNLVGPRQRVNPQDLG